MDNSHDIIQFFPVNGIAGIPLLQHHINDFLKKSFFIKGNHIFPVGHDVLGFRLIKGNDILNHLRFVFLNHALLMSLIHNGDDLLLRHRIFSLIKSHSERLRCQLGNQRNKYGERIKDIRKKVYNAQITIRIFFRITGSDPSERKNSQGCHEHNSQGQYQNQCRQMLYVAVKGIRCPWHQKSTKTNSRCHNNERNGIHIHRRVVH